MSLLEVAFPTAERTSNINPINRVADFEDIIRLDYAVPLRWIPSERATFDSPQTPTALCTSDARHVGDRTDRGETGSCESSIVCFHRSD